MGSKSQFRCNNCEALVKGDSALIAHYRSEHPEDGWGLWDIIGETGDAFADGAMQHLAAKFQSRSDEWERERLELKAKADAYDKHVPRFNKLARAMSIIEQVLETARAEN